MNNFKKIMISAISALLCLSMVACGNASDDDNATTTTPSADVTTTAPTGEDTTSEADTTTTAPVEEKAAVIDPKVDANTLGGKLWNAFLTTMEEKPETTAEEMANLLVTNEAIQFMGSAMPVEVGQEFFVGFGEYKIEGYETGACYMPMIGTIPFVGYVFELAEDADVETFIKNLNDHSVTNWNICTTADQKVAGAYENTVFFLMCPNSLDAE